MTEIFKWSGLGGSLVMVSSFVMAQTVSKPLPAPQGGSEIASRPLLMEPKVQKEIGLTGKQRSALAKTEAEALESSQGVMAEAGDEGFDFNSMMGGVEEADRRRRAAVAKILTPAQKSRILQLEWQREGWLALGRPDVAARLKLSQPQVQKILSMIRAMRQAQTQAHFTTTEGMAQPGSPPKPKPNLNPSNGFIDAGLGPMPGGGPLNFSSDRFQAQAGKTIEAAEKIERKVASEVEQVLTIDQKTEFGQLLGLPFDFQTLTSPPATETASDPLAKNRKATPKKSGKTR